MWYYFSMFMTLNKPNMFVLKTRANSFSVVGKEPAALFCEIPQSPSANGLCFGHSWAEMSTVHKQRWPWQIVELFSFISNLLPWEKDLMGAHSLQHWACSWWNKVGRNFGLHQILNPPWLLLLRFLTLGHNPRPSLLSIPRATHTCPVCNRIGLSPLRPENDSEKYYHTIAAWKTFTGKAKI